MTTIIRDIFVFVTAAIFVVASLLIAGAAGAHEFKVGALDKIRAGQIGRIGNV